MTTVRRDALLGIGALGLQPGKGPVVIAWVA